MTKLNKVKIAIVYDGKYSEYHGEWEVIGRITVVADPNYGADVDGNRGIYKEEITGFEIETMFESNEPFRKIEREGMTARAIEDIEEIALDSDDIEPLD